MSKSLNIHTFLHVNFEGLGCIEQWIAQNGHFSTFTRFYKDYQLPRVEDIDWLIVMGGPMSVTDEQKYPWLVQEKEFIKNAINNHKTVIGICLGSQLIAEVLGAKVYPNKQKEIGWMNVQLVNSSAVLDGFEDKFAVFQWHGDTFDLPDESTHLLQSSVCKNQAFLYNNQVLGLQFHLEVTEESLNLMVENGRDELVQSETVQSETAILEQKNFLKSNNDKMFQILNNLIRQ
jgi:GMP synthase-like glutamine amidotransferase